MEQSAWVQVPLLSAIYFWSFFSLQHICSYIPSSDSLLPPFFVFNLPPTVYSLSKKTDKAPYIIGENRGQNIIRKLNTSYVYKVLRNSEVICQ
ncbi:hypothetical protein F5B17DRAFT_395956 [Nemania serpens]|nr:hypothetical protein F5B17DRAFT_395956 [Nemania serpens]